MPRRKCPKCKSAQVTVRADMLSWRCGSREMLDGRGIRWVKQSESCKTIASLTAEVERLQHTMAATRSRFQKLSEDPNVSAVVQQAYACVLFAIDYPDKIVADYLKEPEHVRPD